METPCWVNSVNIDSSTNLGPGPPTSGSRKWTGAFILRPFLFLSRKKRKQSVPRPGTRERRTTFLSTKNWFPFAGCKKGTTPLPSPPFPSIAANKIIHRSSRVHSYFPAPLPALEEGVATIGRADGRGEDQASSNQTGNARVPYDCAACTSLPPLSIARRDHLDRSSVFQPTCIAIHGQRVDKSQLQFFFFFFFIPVFSSAFSCVPERVLVALLSSILLDLSNFWIQSERERGRVFGRQRKKRSSTILLLLPSDNFRDSIVIVYRRNS